MPSRAADWLAQAEPGLDWGLSALPMPAEIQVYTDAEWTRTAWEHRGLRREVDRGHLADRPMNPGNPLRTPEGGFAAATQNRAVAGRHRPEYPCSHIG